MPPSKPWQDRYTVNEDGCWIWEGPLDRDGYGRCGSQRAHRFVWKMLKGDIAPGMELDHTCNTRACVNPDHLEETTHAENYKRVVERRMEREPNCPDCGEPWSRTKRGTRICKPCTAERRKEARFYGFE